VKDVAELLVVRGVMLECPVIVDARVALAAGQTFEQALRRLRQQMGRCDTCAGRADCLAIVEWNGWIDAAIKSIAEEWGL
jgi:hypothetical protein